MNKRRVLWLAAAAALGGEAAFASSVEIVFDGGGEQLVMESKHLKDVVHRRRDDGVNEVFFQMNSEDATAFEALTRRIEGQTLTVSACGRVLASPTVMLPIVGGSVLVTGGTDETATALLTAIVEGKPCPETEDQ